MNIANLYPLFKLDALSGFISIFIALFTILVIIYSLDFMKGKANQSRYYFYLILTAIASLVVILANSLLVLLVFWGFLGLTLFLLINMGGPEASAAAKKTFIIVGGSDALMLLGIAIIYYLTKEFQMDKISISLSSGSLKLANVAYLCLAVACFAKAGTMPFHTWIPDCAETAPLPVVAYLPAALDKLLGIYLLTRISLDLFVMNQAMKMFLMIIGAFTIIAAVMMALVQHNLKRLLGYHAVSQVGYMVLGIGTGLPIGIAGGLFHMLNNTIYKSCLFLTGGNVEKKTKTAELDRLGGLAKFMPVTYITCLIASLSISGVPPFNGFVSKWMIYQGLVSSFSVGNQHLGVRFILSLCLVAAMFGSALTLASFMKLIHATFLGPMAADKKLKLNEVGWKMWLPCSILAIMCILFGIFYHPFNYFPLSFNLC
jgi:formate hydrogenlyase subunit 3/multisubunit Na+/H+ antiporter MnhD subunit